jgi:uncharacterized membrane protein
MSLSDDPVLAVPILVLVALILIALTVWTYLGVRGATVRRVALVLGLRLLALVLAVLTMLRPSLALQDESRRSSILIIAVDDSESMTIQDEFASQSRWEAVLAELRRCEPRLQRLTDKHNVTIRFYRFAGDVRELDLQDPGNADGPRTDYGEMLRWLYERYRSERNLRGLLVLGDGADRGTRHPALTLAPQWRNLPCPIHTFAVGSPTTSEKQRDIAVTSIAVEPSPVPVKGEFTVKASIDAHGFENQPVLISLLIDDKEVTKQPETLRLTTGNQVRVKWSAPDKPGEIKVTLRVEPKPDETTATNNEMSTFVDVTKEGISVLLVDKERYPEPQNIARALKNEPRIRLYDVTFRRAGPPTPAQVDLFQFDKQHYDVIILGDVSAARLCSGNPQAPAVIKKLVQEQSVGLLMMGGNESFGYSDWHTDLGKGIADVLPVQLKDQDGIPFTEHIQKEAQLMPTPAGLEHFLLRLGETPKESAKIWSSLRPLNGMNHLGQRKPAATVYATFGEGGPPLLVAQDFGKGRTMAFAADTTWRWIHPKVGPGPHARFWKQVVLWLAKQEDLEGNVWVKLDGRRLAAGDKLAFQVGLRGKGGVELPDAHFDVKVIGPRKNDMPVPTVRDKEGHKGIFWKTEVAGEYKIEVTGNGKEADGSAAGGTATARFLVYEDDAEMKQRAANHEFLKALAATGGGQFHMAADLEQFLTTLEKQPLPGSRAKAKLLPDWRRSDSSGILLGIFLLFVLILTLEWFLRRRWGMV